MNKSLIFLSMIIFSLNAMQPNPNLGKRKREELDWDATFDRIIGSACEHQRVFNQAHPELVPEPQVIMLGHIVAGVIAEDHDEDYRDIKQRTLKSRSLLELYNQLDRIKSTHLVTEYTYGFFYERLAEYMKLWSDHYGVDKDEESNVLCRQNQLRVILNNACRAGCAPLVPLLISLGAPKIAEPVFRIYLWIIMGPFAKYYASFIYQNIARTHISRRQSECRS